MEEKTIGTCELCGEEEVELFLTENGDLACEPCIEDSLYWSDPLSEFMEETQFSNPGGRSALRAETPANPRNMPCPTCGRLNVLTPYDVLLGYQCDLCADYDEGGM